MHATNDIAHSDRVAWLDCWVIHDGRGCPGGIADPSKRVQIHFETTGPGNDPQLDAVNPAYVSSNYPLPQTVWRLYYLRGTGSLSTQPPTQGDAGRSYLDAPFGRQAYLSGPGVADSLGDQTGNGVEQAYAQLYGPASSSSGPDELTYTLPFAKESAIAGPVEVTLWATTTGPDADFFVQVVDRDPQGNLSYLQRGLLRASFRAIDPLRSDRIAGGPLAGTIYRPYHLFTNPQDSWSARRTSTTSKSSRLDTSSVPVTSCSFRYTHPLRWTSSMPTVRASRHPLTRSCPIEHTHRASFYRSCLSYRPYTRRHQRAEARLACVVSVHLHK